MLLTFTMYGAFRLLFTIGKKNERKRKKKMGAYNLIVGKIYTIPDYYLAICIFFVIVCSVAVGIIIYAKGKQCLYYTSVRLFGKAYQQDKFFNFLFEVLYIYKLYQ